MTTGVTAVLLAQPKWHPVKALNTIKTMIKVGLQDCLMLGEKSATQTLVKLGEYSIEMSAAN